jgi:hypothetical protein
MCCVPNKEIELEELSILSYYDISERSTEVKTGERRPEPRPKFRSCPVYRSARPPFQTRSGLTTCHWNRSDRCLVRYLGCVTCNWIRSSLCHSLHMDLQVLEMVTGIQGKKAKLVKIAVCEVTSDEIGIYGCGIEEKCSLLPLCLCLYLGHVFCGNTLHNQEAGGDASNSWVCAQGQVQVCLVMDEHSWGSQIANSPPLLPLQLARRRQLICEPPECSSLNKYPMGEQCLLPQCACVYYCSTYYKAVHLGGGARG